MSLLALVASLGGLFLLLECVFFAYCWRWLSAGRARREKEFARLDLERAELLALQASLSSEMREAKRLSEDTLARLGRLGAQASAEWQDMMERLSAVLADVEARTAKLGEESLERVQRSRLTLEKGIRDAHAVGAGLDERLAKARSLLRFFDRNVPTEEIVKELQAEKYDVARKMLGEGIDVGVICKKLGLSQGEVALLSFVK